MSKISQRLGAFAVAVFTTVGLASAPAAQAQDLSSDLSSQLPFEVPNVAADVEDAAWIARTQAFQAAGIIDQIDPALTQQVRAGIDQAIETVYPGIVERRTARPPAPEPPAPAPASAAQPAAPAPAAPAFDYGSCPPQAKACVDLAGQRSWLQQNGKVYYGDVRVATGKPGQETPRGTFYVNRKVKDEISYEFNNAPMPYATYFTYNGIAFHQGNPDYMSAGCVRMYRADAQKYFNDLQIGDMVYVY